MPLGVGRHGVVSIHAPAWGATLEVVTWQRHMELFQSTRPRGARPDISSATVTRNEFQSTRPRGARHLTRRPMGRDVGFNPRARVGRDCGRGLRLHPGKEFQSTRPRGARHALQRRRVRWLGVSIHAPAWGATSGPPSELCRGYAFQSTRPRGARRAPKSRGHAVTMFQSTRPRGARLASPDAISCPLLVSIHAPAWGATCVGRILCLTVGGFNPRARVGRDQPRAVHRRATEVSIHAPAWGATREAGAQRAAPAAFQSTRPRGARLDVLCCPARAAEVSIHAPAWGATPICLGAADAQSGFNPRARVGRDSIGIVVRKSNTLFQSTRPRGARLLSAAAAKCPRHVSIHAPAWGATVTDVAPAASVSMFQSTRPRGARPNRLNKPVRDLRVSIHAPAWGATPHARENGRRNRSFNPRARVGRDGSVLASCSLAPSVSIHAPAWGATHRSSDSAKARASFNPRARVGRDRCVGALDGKGLWFQSTRPRGARRAVVLVLRDRQRVSIHAPAWGATVGLRVRRTGDRVSIHAPAWGATRNFYLRPAALRCFNPRARVGRDAMRSVSVTRPAKFQSTRPRGARPGARAARTLDQWFQSTRPRGARP